MKSMFFIPETSNFELHNKMCHPMTDHFLIAYV